MEAHLSPLRPGRHEWTIKDLYAELAEFELVLRAKGLRDSSIDTNVDRTRRFIRWLDGDYEPSGPR